MCGITPGRLLNIASTRPGMRSFMAGPAPRYGMWAISIPVLRLKSSPLRCGDAPIPVEAYETLPRFALAYSMNSLSDLAGDEFGTIITLGMIVTRVTGARSLAGLYPVG